MIGQCEVCGQWHTGEHPITVMTPTTSDREALIAAAEEIEYGHAWISREAASTIIYKHADALTREQREVPPGLYDLDPYRLPQQEAQGAVAYAQRLATTMWREHYADDAPNWQPFDDLMGVLSQIDNMLAGLPRDAFVAATPPAPVDDMGTDAECQMHRAAHNRIDSIVMGEGVFELLYEGGEDAAWENTIAAVRKLAEKHTPAPAKQEVPQASLVDVREVLRLLDNVTASTDTEADYLGQAENMLRALLDGQQAGVDDAMVERFCEVAFQPWGKSAFNDDLVRNLVRPALQAALGGGVRS